VADNGVTALGRSVVTRGLHPESRPLANDTDPPGNGSAAPTAANPNAAPNLALRDSLTRPPSQTRRARGRRESTCPAHSRVA